VHFLRTQICRFLPCPPKWGLSRQLEQVPHSVPRGEEHPEHPPHLSLPHNLVLEEGEGVEVVVEEGVEVVVDEGVEVVVEEGVKLGVEEGVEVGTLLLWGFWLPKLMLPVMLTLLVMDFLVRLLAM